jgi:hypothetical protein
MPSLEMREYLKSIEIKPWYVPNIIYFSIHPLSEKLEAMKDLDKHAQKVNDQNLRKETQFYIRNMEDALKMLDVEGVFVLHEWYYDEDKMEANGDFETLCSSYVDVIEYWEKYFKPDDDSQSEYLEWNVVEKWVKDENGKMNLISSYILINGVLVYSQLKYRFYNDDDGDDLYEMQYGEMAHLNLPIPFKAGDIVEVDGFPFGPVFRIAIVEVGDNIDCCCVQGMSKNYKGEWEVCAVKHGHFVNSYPVLSHLYTMRTYTGNLPDDEKIMLKVKEYIAGDEEKGRRFWNCFGRYEKKGRVTEETIQEMLANDCRVQNKQQT